MLYLTILNIAFYARCSKKLLRGKLIHGTLGDIQTKDFHGGRVAIIREENPGDFVNANNMKMLPVILPLTTGCMAESKSSVLLETCQQHTGIKMDRYVRKEAVAFIPSERAQWNKVHWNSSKRFFVHPI